jgi:branched-chain amino acid transport system ATP-binding protein
MNMLLECSHLVRSYGGVIALAGVSLNVREREILGVIGPNGSGKSTLLDLLSGVTPASSGRTTFDGKDISALPAWRIARLGLSRTFQMLRLFPHLTVLSNMTVGESWRLNSGYLGSAFRSAAARREESELAERARRLLVEFDMAAFIDRYPSELSIGQQRLVEIARCLMSSPQLLFLDEPAAGLSPPNVDRLVGHIKRIRNEYGTTIVLVEHVMRVVRAVCDRVVVLDYGERIAEGTPDEVTRDPRVIEAYLGLGRATADA